jgi:hypothetical protein
MEPMRLIYKYLSVIFASSLIISLAATDVFAATTTTTALAKPTSCADITPIMQAAITNIDATNDNVIKTIATNNANRTAAQIKYDTNKIKLWANQDIQLVASESQLKSLATTTAEASAVAAYDNSITQANTTYRNSFNSFETADEAAINAAVTAESTALSKAVSALRTADTDARVNAVAQCGALGLGNTLITLKSKLTTNLANYKALIVASNKALVSQLATIKQNQVTQISQISVARITAIKAAIAQIDSAFSS